MRWPSLTFLYDISYMSGVPTRNPKPKNHTQMCDPSRMVTIKFSLFCGILWSLLYRYCRIGNNARNILFHSKAPKKPFTARAKNPRVLAVISGQPRWLLHDSARGQIKFSNGNSLIKFEFSSLHNVNIWSKYVMVRDLKRVLNGTKIY